MIEICEIGELSQEKVLNQDSALKFCRLTTGYADRVVSKELTAELYSGRLTCLLGANGIGKSTLLRTLAGYQSALAGELDEVSPETIGVVLTERIDAFGLKVREVVALGRHPYTGYFGNMSKEDDAIVSEAMSLTHTEALASRLFSSLSDGEKQKVMIAKALAQQTPIILMDEPSAFLDFPSKVELMLLLQKLAHEQGKAILLSTHDVGIALKMADTLWLMCDDRMVVGTTAELTDNGDIDRFLGDSRAFI
ncbi:MAG: ABC transporter ATP-binding protein [Bacteroidaceae bacterium]|nr:ABC transporter ATP-binding protein [Bacteroidaceae bacterium]